MQGALKGEREREGRRERDINHLKTMMLLLLYILASGLLSSTKITLGEEETSCCFCSSPSVRIDSAPIACDDEVM